jgi:hypothetical protein
MMLVIVTSKPTIDGETLLQEGPSFDVLPCVQ